MYKLHQHASVLAAAAKSLQSCPTLCDPIDGSPPGSPIPGILQARTLEWVAISFSNAWKWKVKVKTLSCIQLLAIPWTAAYQATLSMWFSRQEYWSGLPLPSLASVLGRVQLLATLWTVAHQASLSLGFSRQEYWSMLPFPSPGDLPIPGIKPESPVSPALAGEFFTPKAWEAQNNIYCILNINNVWCVQFIVFYSKVKKNRIVKQL